MKNAAFQLVLMGLRCDYDGGNSDPLHFEKKGSNPDHSNPKHAIDDGDVMCVARAIEMSTNHEDGTATANAHRQVTSG